MTESKPDWVLFMEDLDRPLLSLEERATEIADVLASGSASPEFFQTLAQMIRPNGHSPSDMVMELRYKRRNEPRRIAWRIGVDMHELIDRQKASIDEAVYQIRRKYGEDGTSRSRCLACLKAHREMERAWDVLNSASPE